MLTHAEINARFVELDGHPALMRACLDGWLAWPIVKERLWLLCGAYGEGGAPGGRPRRGVRRLLSGVGQLLRVLVAARPCDTALLYTPRRGILPDGREVHPNLGDLGALQSDGPWLHYVFGGDGERVRTAGAPVLDHAGLGALAAATARLGRGASGVRRVGAEIVDAVAPTLPEIPRLVLERTVRDALARFRVRLRLTRWLLRRFGVRRMVVLDPDGKVAEVAAAKALGLPVVEVQHGMFSAREPDYSWAETHRTVPGRMPLPGAVVVFGPLWRRELRRAGYWDDAAVSSARSPLVAAWRARRADRPLRFAGAPVTVLFPTQHYVRDTAIEFWSRVLELQAADGTDDLRLRIKLHPAEHADAAAYRELEAAHPGRCALVAAGRDGFAEMVEADLVAGYTTLMMMEAVGLGLPVVGLRGGAAREGFCATFDTPELSEVIADIETPETFAARLPEWRAGGLDVLAAASAAGSAQIYDLDAPPVEDVLRSLGEDRPRHG